MPSHVGVNGGEHSSDHAWGTRIDVAVGLHVAFRNRPNTRQDALCSCVVSWHGSGFSFLDSSHPVKGPHVADTSTSGDSESALPEVISLYQQAHDRRDTEVALSTFASDARVVDDGHEYRGTDEIRTWLTTATSQFTFTRTLLSAQATGSGEWLVVNRLEGDFPGGVVDLRYRFALTDKLISELIIAP